MDNYVLLTRYRICSIERTVFLLYSNLSQNKTFENCNYAIQKLDSSEIYILWYFIVHLSNRSQVSMVYRMIKPLGMLEDHSKNL